MSGGVDSTLAAFLLREQGCEVVGVTMKFWPCSAFDDVQDRPNVCCSPDDISDAARAAARFGIRHYVCNFEDEFEQAVISPFCDEYAHGRTPNPCIRCNQHIKFQAFLKRAQMIGCENIATGHYARKGFDEKTGRHLLLRPRDTTKDQTYFLFTLTQEQLDRTRFPLADTTKEQAREKLHHLGLTKLSTKEESQDICFVRQGSYREFVRRRRPDAFRPGPIMDTKGNVIAEHEGIGNFTIGQRRGLNLSAGRPVYVVRINGEQNAVVVGEEQELWQDQLTAQHCNWIAFARPPRAMRCSAKIRYRNPAVPCTVDAESDGTTHVKFHQQQRAVTPGQAVVFYDGDCCLGGGWIDCVRGSAGRFV